KQFISEYKFVISFENKRYPGYLTEKIVEPMLVNSIPIYWGDPMVDNEFNPKSFINVSDFESVDKAIQHIIELDQNDEKYKSYLREPWFANNVLNEDHLQENLIKKIIE